MTDLKNTKYLLIHGFASSSKSYFFPYLAGQLEELGATVIAPDFPSPNSPQFYHWIDHARSNLSGIEEIDMIVGHSLGGLLALQLLSKGIVTAKRAILIGSSFGPKSNSDMNSFLIEPLNLDVIRRGVEEIYSAFSFDDPWTPAEYGILKVKQLNAIGISFCNLGHFECSRLPKILETIIFKT